MANITVTFADGQPHIYQNVPDNITPDQIEQRAAKDFAGRKVKHLDRQTGDAPRETIQADQPAQEQGGLRDWNRRMGQTIANVGAGALKGASQIGATILAPLDATGITGMTSAERRAAVTGGLQEMGADPESLAFKTGEIGTEIAGTAGIGGALAKGAMAGARYAPQIAPMVAKSLQTGGFATGAPSAPAMSLAGARNAAIRVGGGAASGAAMAGAINPDDAGVGAVIGAGIPVAGKLAGETGKIASARLKEFNAQAAVKAAQLTPKRETLQEAVKAGYVIPPSYAGGGLSSRLAEGLSGKYKTNQAAGIRNQEVTDSLARKAVGLQENQPLTSEAMQGIRAKSYTQGYEPIGEIGTIATDKAYADALAKIEKPFVMAVKSFPEMTRNMHGQIVPKALPTDDILRSLRVNKFNSREALSKIQNLRNDASAAYAKGDNVLGKANKEAAAALEDVIQRNLEFKANAKSAYHGISDIIGKRMSGADFDATQKAKTIIGQLSSGKITHDMAIERLGLISTKSKTATNALSDAASKISHANNEAEKAKKLLDNFRESRTLMAKAHTIENAIKEGGGNVDATKLAARLQAGKPITGELETIAKFANVFRDVARIPNSGDAVPFTALDFMQTGLSAPLGILAGGPAGATAALALPAARIASRQAILSKPVQKTLAQNAFQPNRLAALLGQKVTNPALVNLPGNALARAALIQSR